tara:strand:+ start:51898 stop:52233 length:336 start_codon:yes stop_codon:yes gene_type:complete
MNMMDHAGLYTIAGWTLRVIDAHHHELEATVCELCPTGLFIKAKSSEHGLSKDGRVLVLFCSGDLRFELGATVATVGWCSEINAEGIGLKLDSLAPELVGTFITTPTLAGR